MKRVLWVIVTLLMVPTVDAVSSNSPRIFGQDSRIKVIKPVINEAGWKIPGLERSHITGARKVLPRGYGPVSVPLHVTVLEPRRKLVTTISRYGLKDGQTLIIAERKVVVDEIIKCDVNNQVFVYILHCTIILEEPGGRAGYSGTFGLHYYDRDGDGKFESFEEGAPFVTSDLRVPGWVLKKP